MKDFFTFDGALGTYITTKKIKIDFPEMANITNRNTVYDIHKEYINSGVDAIKTNTFAANSTLISDNNILKAIIENGYIIASQAVLDTNVKVFADIGPINHEKSSDEYIKIADIFIKCGATNFLFETLSEIKNLKEVIAHIKNNVKNAVIITSFAVSQDGYTKSGEYYKSLFDEAVLFGVNYVGLNCICGPAHMLSLIKDIEARKYNLIAMPNAGYPSVIGGRTIYVDNPEYFADKLFKIYSCGVKGIGGCCGTTPKHIKAIVEKFQDIKSQIPEKIITKEREKNVTVNAFNFNKTLIAVEISSPINTDIGYVLEASKKAKECGADFVTVPDSPIGKARANSFMISSLIQRRIGIKAIPHMCCRDKNQIAIKGDLIGANIEEITNVLAITGDSICETDRAHAKNVFGFNSYKLISFIKSLNETVFVDKPYSICAALNINSANFDLELKRAQIKIENGAICFLTQPISDININNYFRAKKILGCKILAGIMVLAGYKNALFLNNEVPGIEIPNEILENLKDKNPEDTKEICINYAKSIVDKIKSNCDGYYIMTSLKKIDFSAEIIKYIRGDTKCL